MGTTVPPRDEPALARALIDVIANRERYVRPREEIAARFSVEATVDAYEQIYRGER
jgi:glycosyltransferase involved in cell wall biosynthesis